MWCVGQGAFDFVCCQSVWFGVSIVAKVFDLYFYRCQCVWFFHQTRTTQGIPALTAFLPTDYSVSWNQVTVECSDYFEHLRIQAPLIKFSATLRTIFSVSLCLNNQSPTCPHTTRRKRKKVPIKRRNREILFKRRKCRNHKVLLKSRTVKFSISQLILSCFNFPHDCFSITTQNNICTAIQFRQKLFTLILLTQKHKRQKKD